MHSNHQSKSDKRHLRRTALPRGLLEVFRLEKDQAGLENGLLVGVVGEVEDAVLEHAAVVLRLREVGRAVDHLDDVVVRALELQVGDAVQGDGPLA